VQTQLQATLDKLQGQADKAIEGFAAGVPTGSDHHSRYLQFLARRHIGHVTDLIAGQMQHARNKAQYELVYLPGAGQTSPATSGGAIASGGSSTSSAPTSATTGTSSASAGTSSSTTPAASTATQTASTSQAATAAAPAAKSASSAAAAAVKALSNSIAAKRAISVTHLVQPDNQHKIKPADNDDDDHKAPAAKAHAAKAHVAKTHPKDNDDDDHKRA
jgi:hypothetical protein